MRSKFVFKPVSKTFSDPVAAQFKAGAPFGREFSRGDIVLLHPEISASKTYLNSNVLRDAMLTSKDFLEEALGIKIMDVRTAPDSIEEETTDIEVKPKKTSRKKVSEETVESKEDIIADEVIITGVDTVPEGEEIIDEVIIDATEEAAKDIEDSLILDEEPLNKEE